MTIFRSFSVIARSVSDEAISYSHKWSEYKPSFLVAALILAWFAQEQLFARHLVSGLWLWLGAGIIAAWSFAGQPDRLKADKVRVRYESLLLILIFLIALLFRFWKLSGIPNGYFTDEACCAMIGTGLFASLWLGPGEIRFFLLS